MKLSEIHRPRSLSDVIGQSKPLRILRGWMKSPYSSAWLFRGGPGIGKTSTALALANDLGSLDSTQVIPCSDLGIDRARELVRALSLRPMFGGKWNILILEELERLSPACQQFLKVGFEDLAPRALILATSNDTTGIDPALIQRFTPLEFTCGTDFYKPAQEKLLELWNDATGGDDPPKDFLKWGFDGARGYSLRVAYDRLQQELLFRSVEEPVAA